MSASILVLEDDINMKELVAEYLEEAGYQVFGAESVRAADEIARKQRLDLLIADIRMAEVDGVEGFRALQAIHPNLKCILITGYADSEAQGRAITLTVDDFLYKPFLLKELMRSVRRVLTGNTLMGAMSEALDEGSGRFLTAVKRYFRKERDLFAAVDDVRKECYQGFYVSIRSKLISVNTANGVFGKLTELDLQFKEYLMTPERDRAETLEADYQTLFRFLCALARSSSPMLGGDRLPASEFRSLYQATQQGEVSPEQLQLAATLKEIDSKELQNSPELLELRSKLWGEAS